MQKHRGVYKVYYVTIHEDLNRVFVKNKCIGKWTDFKFNVQMHRPDLFHKHKLSARLEQNQITYQVNWPELIDEMVKNKLL